MISTVELSELLAIPSTTKLSSGAWRVLLGHLTAGGHDSSRGNAGIAIECETTV
jgi:hypothetical protein